jgi:hypothetical protein
MRHATCTRLLTQKANGSRRARSSALDALCMVDGAPILRVEHLSGPYEVPDDSGQPCRYLLFQIDTRGVPA